jgi:hypothetical protein
MIFIYIVLGLLIIVIVFNIAVRLKFPFWSIQPVFHIYDLKHWILPNRIINNSIPSPNKYLRLLDVESHEIKNILNETKVKITSFIQEHFLRNNYVDYVPSKEDIFNYLETALLSSYVSLYLKPSMLIEEDGISSPKIIMDREILGVISARPMYITLNKETMPIFYVDNLCVHTDERNKGIAPSLIQTHYYHLYNKTCGIKPNNVRGSAGVSPTKLSAPICLFKREGNMTAIVPLTIFNTIGYDCNTIPNKDKFPIYFKLIKITIQNIQLFREFFKSQAGIKFKCVIQPELELIMKLIKSENIVIYGLIHNHNLLSLYVFRKVPSYLKLNKGYCFECIASIDNTPNKSIFIGGFCSAIRRYCRKYKSDIFFVEDTSHNHRLIDYLNYNKIKITAQYPTAFFLYNYVSYSIDKKDCLIIY